jgi:hypothetical protein
MGYFESSPIHTIEHSLKETSGEGSKEFTGPCLEISGIHKYHCPLVMTCKDNSWEISIGSLHEKQKNPLMKLPTSCSKFSREGVLKHLILWIAADDQVC